MKRRATDALGDNPSFAFPALFIAQIHNKSEHAAIGKEFGFIFEWWKWWESNPRPKAHSLDFLRAHPMIEFSPNLLPIGRPQSELSR